MMRKEIPLRPEPAGSKELSDRLWDLLTACWNYEPKDRPTCKMLQASITEIGIQDNRPPLVGTEDSGTFGGTVGEGPSPELDYPRLQEILFHVSANASVPSPSPGGSTNTQLTEPHPKCSPLPQSLAQPTNIQLMAPLPPSLDQPAGIQLMMPDTKRSSSPQPLTQSVDTIEHAPQPRTGPSMNTTKP